MQNMVTTPLVSSQSRGGGKGQSLYGTSMGDEEIGLSDSVPLLAPE